MASRGINNPEAEVWKPGGTVSRLQAPVSRLLQSEAIKLYIYRL